MGAGITSGINLNGSQSYPEPKEMITIMSNAIDIAIDLRTRDLLLQADFVISLNLEKYSRLNNGKQFEEIYFEGHLYTKQKINELFWYRTVRLAFYLKKLYLAIIPFKIPSLIIWRKG